MHEVQPNLPWLLPAIAMAFGLVIGSFLNVVIHRVPLEESIVFPGSRCPSCSSEIKPYDNVPVLSWLLLRGRCRSCGVSISMRYPAVELATGLLFAAVAWRVGPGWPLLLFAIFTAFLVAAAMIDVDHQIIPDEISLGGLVFGLIAVPLVHWLTGADYLAALKFSVLGAGIGAGLLWIVGFVHARVSVALGREFEHWPGEGEAVPRPQSLDYWIWFPGLGFGDVKLLAMIGAFLGPWGVLETIFAASLIGLVMGLAWALVTRKPGSPFGFAPAIAAGALLSLLLPLHLVDLLR